METYKNQLSWERTRVLWEETTLDNKKFTLRKAQSELDSRETARPSTTTTLAWTKVEERELQEGRKNMFINVPPPT